MEARTAAFRGASADDLKQNKNFKTLYLFY